MKLIDQQNPKRNLTLVYCIYLAIAVFFYAMLCLTAVLNLVDAAGSVHWLSAPGKVAMGLDSEQVFSTNSPGNIWYEYTVGQNLYRSQRVNFFERGVLENYPTGLDVTVYYNPHDPSDSCLIRGIQPIGLVTVCSVALSLLSGGYLLWRALRNWFKAGSKSSSTIPVTAI